RRPLGAGEFAAVLATQRMLLMRADLRLDERQLPDILGAHGTGIIAPLKQLALAGRALLRIMVLHRPDLLRRWVRALVMRMSRLGSDFATARVPRGAWRRRRRVGGRWFGGVLAVLVQTGLQLSHTSLEKQEVLLLVGKLLLLSGENLHKHTDELREC